MDVVPPLVADREPTVFGKPRQCPLHHPSLCRPSFSLLSMPFLAMRLLMERFLRVRLHFLSS